MNDIQKQAFIYSTGWVPMSIIVGTPITKTVKFSGIEDFICNFITGHVRQSDLLVATWAGLVQVQLSGSERTLFSEAIAFDAIAGDGRQPYPFDPPKLFPGKSTIQVVFTTNVVTPTDVQLVFHGNKVIRGQGALLSPEI